MARMHSRNKGNSGSKRPLKPSKPTWMRYKSKELEMLVVKLAKEGKTSSKIGIILRDSYGVPDVYQLTGKTITQLMAEKKLLPELPEDLFSLMKQAAMVRKHVEAHKQDMTALRGLQLTESKMGRLAKYYKKVGKIPVDWKYSPQELKILIE